MRVLHIVAADRWTGAAASALELVEALRGAGCDAAMLFRSGRNLAERLAGRDWAHAALAKERSIADLHRSIGALRGLAAGCDAVHAHLPHDHALARLAFAHAQIPIVRSIRHRKHLRADPFHRWLLRGTAAIALANSSMEPALGRFRFLRDRSTVVVPPVVEPRFVLPPGSEAHAAARRASRVALGVPAGAVIVGAVGKLDRGRGQDVVLRAAAATPGVHTVIVGHGPAEKGLRTLARKLGIADRVWFTGYVDEGLERLYAAMDLFVYPAAGSDHGHRAIAEASGCGLPTLAADLPGVSDLVTPGATGGLYPPDDAAALGVLLRNWSTDASLRAETAAAVTRRASTWTPAACAARITSLYAGAVAASGVRR